MSDTTKNCRICQAAFEPYDMGMKNDYKLAACKNCGSVFAEPWPTKDELETLYGDIQPEIVHVPNPEAQIAAMKQLMLKLELPVAGKRFLDIGSRQGYAVMAAKELGYKEVKGIDAHEFFTTFAKDKYPSALFENASVEDYAQRGEQAEVVFSIENFCEQTDPDAYMAALAQIVPSKGILYIQEPDGNSIHLPSNFSRWRFVDPPFNFSYISEKGMRALLARHGFRVQRKLFTWGPQMRLIAVKK